jgi:hypothetical protein
MASIYRRRKAATILASQANTKNMVAVHMKWRDIESEKYSDVKI